LSSCLSLACTPVSPSHVFSHIKPGSHDVQTPWHTFLIQIVWQAHALVSQNGFREPPTSQKKRLLLSIGRVSVQPRFHCHNHVSPRRTLDIGFTDDQSIPTDIFHLDLRFSPTPLGEDLTMPWDRVHREELLPLQYIVHLHRTQKPHRDWSLRV
jgi:hypothetical protein